MRPEIKRHLLLCFLVFILLLLAWNASVVAGNTTNTFCFFSYRLTYIYISVTSFCVHIELEPRGGVHLYLFVGVSVYVCVRERGSSPLITISLLLKMHACCGN